MRPNSRSSRTWDSPAIRSRSRIESPCIDRNGRAAAQALVAAQGAVRVLEPPVALDAVVASMIESARTMAGRYKQASLGGVAMSMPDC